MRATENSSLQANRLPRLQSIVSCSKIVWTLLKPDQAGVRSDICLPELGIPVRDKAAIKFRNCTGLQACSRQGSSTDDLRNSTCLKQHHGTARSDDCVSYWMSLPTLEFGASRISHQASGMLPIMSMTIPMLRQRRSP